MTEIYRFINLQQSSQICNMLTKNIGWYLNGSYKNRISNDECYSKNGQNYLVSHMRFIPGSEIE